MATFDIGKGRHQLAMTIRDIDAHSLEETKDAMDLMSEISSSIDNDDFDDFQDMMHCYDDSVLDDIVEEVLGIGGDLFRPSLRLHLIK
jgi:hypothetical protein